MAHAPPSTNAPSGAWELFAFIAGLVVGVVFASFVRRPRLGTAVLAAVVAAGLGLIGAVGHAFLVSSGSKVPWTPSFDTTTLWWVVLIAAGVALPVISEITVGGVNLTLVKAQAVTLRATDLMQTWAYTTRDLLAELEDTGLSKQRAVESVTKFLQLRAYEALEWIGQDKEDRRLSIWTANAATQRLQFFFSNEVRDSETTGTTFAIGEGIIGTVFQTQETWNERDAPSLPIWKEIRKEKPRYHGLFCTPIDYGDYAIGVLSVDRQEKERFQDDHVDVLTAFAAMVGTILGNEKTRTFLTGPDIDVA